MAFCYILFSQKLNRFYIGSTSLDPIDRLNLHRNKAYGNKKFTAKADDWEIFIEFQCKSISQAKRIETFIKRMKSRKYILSLKSEPERIKWLLEKF